MNLEYLSKFPPIRYSELSEQEPTTTAIKKNTYDIEIWACFTITKNPCDKITMDEAFKHYKKNTPNSLTKIKFGKELIKKEGISKDFLYIGKNKNGNDYRVRCWCGLRLKSISSNIEEDIQPKSYLIDL